MLRCHDVLRVYAVSTLSAAVYQHYPAIVMQCHLYVFVMPCRQDDEQKDHASC